MVNATPPLVVALSPKNDPCCQPGYVCPRAVLSCSHFCSSNAMSTGMRRVGFEYGGVNDHKGG